MAGSPYQVSQRTISRNKTSLLMQPEVQKRIREWIPDWRSADIYFYISGFAKKEDPEKWICTGDRISLVRASMISCICCTDIRSVILYQRVRSALESKILLVMVFRADLISGKRKTDRKSPFFEQILAGSGSLRLPETEPQPEQNKPSVHGPAAIPCDGQNYFTMLN